MSGTISDILSRGDRAALTTWLADPHADMSMEGNLAWNGPVDAQLGADLAAMLMRCYQWSPSQCVEMILHRFTKRRMSRPAHHAFLHALLLHIGRTDTRLTQDDGITLLQGLDFFDWYRDKALTRLTCFAPIYDTIARCLPASQACAHVRSKLLDHEGSLAQISYLLAIYGWDAFLPHISPLVREAHDRALFHYLDDNQTHLVHILAKASAHAILPLVGRTDLAGQRQFPPHLIQRHLVDRAKGLQDPGHATTLAGTMLGEKGPHQGARDGPS